MVVLWLPCKALAALSYQYTGMQYVPRGMGGESCRGLNNHVVSHSQGAHAASSHSHSHRQGAHAASGLQPLHHAVFDQQ
jgi:hypothetical protein